MSLLNQQKLRAIYDEFKIPPNVANIRVEGPIPTIADVKSGFLKAGLTAADLTPIDWRKKIQISPVKNQQSCGDCWAMSSTSALTDRFIAQKGIANLDLSPAVTAQCTIAGPQQSLNDGCQGGLPFLAGQFFENFGCPEAEGNCPSWEKICGGPNCSLPGCDQLKNACQSATIYKAKKGSTKNLSAQSGVTFDVNSTIANIKKELLNGPVVACYFVQIDFMASVFYKWSATNGIYINGAYGDDLDKMAPDKFKSRFNNPVGNQWGEQNAGAHAVEVVGWDIGDAGKKYGKVAYWIVKNSWGPEWNESGYFRIAMSDSGVNKNIAFDVPISIQGQQFGGCVSFDPDLTTGKEGSNPTPPGPNNDYFSPDRKKVMLQTAINFGIILGVVLLVYFGYRFYKSRKLSNPTRQKYDNPYLTNLNREFGISDSGNQLFPKIQ